MACPSPWLPDDVAVTHVQIGTVVVTDRKMLKTRSGDSPRRDPDAQDAPVVIGDPAERELALLLLGFGEVVVDVGTELAPIACVPICSTSRMRSAPSTSGAPC